MKMDNVKELLPQREPFLFVDALSAAGMDIIAAVKSYGSDFVFAQCAEGGQKYVPTAIIVESLVQCGGAGIKKIGLFGGVFALASVDKVRIRGLVELPATVDMTIRTIKATGKILRQTGEARCGGRFVLSARWSCVFLNDAPLRPGRP
jgi:3-hydroxyacyl-[acyl-carrier-protein] dehydratase